MASRQAAGPPRICKSCGKAVESDLVRCPDDGSELICTISPELRIGTTIDDQFTIRAVLGQGGMGVVYRAVQHSMEREVALKLLHPGAATDEQAVRRFLQEARAVSRMRHPHVITVFDFGQTSEGDLYLVMELLEGRSVGAELEARRRLSPERAAAIVTQACGAIHHAHDQGLVHRDLKPDNLFLVENVFKNQDFVKVLDFGVAKVRHVDGAERITRSGVLFGTPGYISPEQVLGSPVDRRADVYSMGVILFELLTGRLPFDDPSPMKQLLAHISHAPPRMADVCPEASIPPAVSALVARCLSKDRDQRPATALLLADALAEALAPGCTLAIAATDEVAAVGEWAAPSDVIGRAPTLAAAPAALTPAVPERPQTLVGETPAEPAARIDNPTIPAAAPTQARAATVQSESDAALSRAPRPSWTAPVIVRAAEAASARWRWARTIGMGAVGLALLVGGLLVWQRPADHEAEPLGLSAPSALAAELAMPLRERGAGAGRPGAQSTQLRGTKDQLNGTSRTARTASAPLGEPAGAQPAEPPATSARHTEAPVLHARGPVVPADPVPIAIAVAREAAAPQADEASPVPADATPTGTAGATAGGPGGARAGIGAPRRAPPSKAQSDAIRLSTSPPGATVRVDGEPAGRTPLRIALPDAGSRTISLKLDGYQSETVRIERGSGDRHVELRRREATRQQAEPPPHLRGAGIIE